MKMSGPSQVLRRTGGAVFGVDEDTQLDYNIQEQNWMELELRMKPLPAEYDSQYLKNARAELALQSDKPSPHAGINMDFQKSTPDLQTNYSFMKKIGCMAGPKTLLALDVDVRSLDGLKFYGLRPTVTHQYDKLTKLRMGFSMMPGSTAIILGASRAIAEGM